VNRWKDCVNLKGVSITLLSN